MRKKINAISLDRRDSITVYCLARMGLEGSADPMEILRTITSFFEKAP